MSKGCVDLSVAEPLVSFDQSDPYCSWTASLTLTVSLPPLLIVKSFLHSA